MVNGDLLRELFRGFSQRNDEEFRTAAKAIIAEERARNHRLLADDLERILLNGSRPTNGRTGELFADTPRDKERGLPLVDIGQFDYEWSRIVLQPKALGALQQIAEEHRRRDVLAAAGLKPKQRVLFFGPPGCGKTLAARVLASILGYQLITVRFDAVVSSYLGETAANLRRVFDFVQRGRWVVLLDEFDAIGKDRDNQFEHGELKRLVNSLLQMMDAFRGESLLIAATNHENLLDNALWRRFESVIQFPKPTMQDRVLLLRLFLRGFDSTQLDLEQIGRRTGRATGADLEWVALEAARQATLAGRKAILMKDLQPILVSLHERISGMQSTPVARKPPKRKVK